MLKKTTGASLPPGPSVTEIPKWYYRLKNDTFEAFVALTNRYGDVVRFPLWPGRALVISATPEFAQHVLQDHHRDFKKAITYSFLEPVVGKGLLTSEGDVWLRQRRLVAPMFHRRRVDNYAKTMVETTRQMLRDWEQHVDGEPFDVTDSMSKLTLSIAGKLLFNRDIGDDSDWIGDAMLLLFRDTNQRITSLVSMPRKVPTPHNRKVQRALDSLEGLVYDMIDERRGEAENYDDLLSTFMLAEDEETGERMTDAQIRDELMTFMLAGHETTSNLLSWALYLLSTHPDVRRRVEREVDDRVAGEVPTLEEVQKLDYLEQVIDETLRLYPPAWTVDREPVEDTEICGYHIPAGSVLSIGPYFVHHNPDVWDNPEGFDPSRFDAEHRGTRHRYAHFPFGGGPRMCVGADFAIMEAKVILASIARRFRLNLVPDHRVEPEATVTLYPRHGIDMVARRRSSGG